MKVKKEVLYVSEQPESKSTMANKTLVRKKIAFIIMLLITVLIVAVIVLAAVLCTQSYFSRTNSELIPPGLHETAAGVAQCMEINSVKAK